MGGLLSLPMSTTAFAPLCCSAIGIRGYSSPLFNIGLVADVQAAEKADEAGEGRSQRFSTATGRLSAAVAYWLGRRLACVLSLGDLVDGRESEEATTADLRRVMAQFGRLAVPVHHTIGNHCLKHLPRASLLAALKLQSSYYCAELAPGWRLLVLDTTELSTHGR